MSTHKDLSSLPPAVLRAALEASEKRVERERDKIKKEMCQLQKRLDELEKGPDIPKREEPEKPAASESKGVKRRRVGSSSDESVEVVDVEEWYDRQWPIAKARKPSEGSRRPSCSRCRKRGVPCEWDKSSGSKSQRCLGCRRSHLSCSLKHPKTAGRGE